MRRVHLMSVYWTENDGVVMECRKLDAEQMSAVASAVLDLAVAHGATVGGIVTGMDSKRLKLHGAVPPPATTEIN